MQLNCIVYKQIEACILSKVVTNNRSLLLIKLTDDVFCNLHHTILSTFFHTKKNRLSISLFKLKVKIEKKNMQKCFWNKNNIYLNLFRFRLKRRFVLNLKRINFESLIIIQYVLINFNHKLYFKMCINETLGLNHKFYVKSYINHKY